MHIFLQRHGFEARGMLRYEGQEFEDSRRCCMELLKHVFRGPQAALYFVSAFFLSSQPWVLMTRWGSFNWSQLRVPLALGMIRGYPWNSLCTDC